MADNIGTAYVQIEPSFEGVTPKIEQHFGGEGEKASKSFGSGFASVAGTVGKVMTGAVTAAGTAVAGLTKQAVSAFAEFEQVQGGAELLFGEGYGKVITNANKAFSEVQMSINDYLTTANSYATGLKTALGNDEMAAADLADKIIRAQADVVAATGASQESIANAFSGIMKNNFTMLDNLQLGIKPTKEGMQEVIDKMNEWNASQGNATKYQMGNLADMQSAIVDYIAYVGMAGYAHEEGSKTIQGSLAQAKASWENLLTAVGTGDLDFISDAIDNLVDSVGKLGKNIEPVIEKALKGISELISRLAPEIAAALPNLAQQMLPGLLKAGVDIIKALGEGILQAIPVLMPTITDVILQLCNMLVSMLPELIQVGAQIILQLAMGLAQALPQLIPAIVDAITTIVGYFLDNVDMIVDASIALIMALANGLIEAQPKLIAKAPEIIIKLTEALIKNAPKIIQASVELILMLVKGLVDGFGQLMNAGRQLVDKVKEGFSSHKDDAKNWGRDMIQNFINGIMEKWNALKQSVSNVASTIKSYLHFSQPDVGPLKDFDTYAPDMMELFAEGIKKNVGIVSSALNSATGQIMSSGLNIDSISQVQASVNPSGVGSDNSIVERIESLLREIIPNLNQDLYLDTGALVGGTVAAYNTALGRIAVRGSSR